ncbi:MAG: glutamate ABC transporter substrate-binding protein [Actinomycetota bacterium]|nr:glutamate ABC transporter substrate-binding protein [Actinomycetota bacterium]
MSRSRLRLRLRRPAVGLVAASVLLTAACSSAGYTATPVPTATTTSAPAASSPPPGDGCPPPTTNLTSYAPLPPGARAELPRFPNNRLRVGVSADTLLLGARDPVTTQIQGFDIDLARAVAKAALGSEDRIQLVVITAADRVPFLTSGKVDMVARNMSMTCGRWADIAFSAEYYQAGLKLLVAKGQTASFPALKGKRVCAPTGTSTLTFVQNQGSVTAVGARDHTSCLVLFQAGKVDAIAGDDTVLAGLAAQDPYASVPTQPVLTSEPYGLGFSQKNVGLVRLANRVLDDLKSGPGWKQLYDKWFAASLGPAPAPPASVYGRS